MLTFIDRDHLMLQSFVNRGTMTFRQQIQFIDAKNAVICLNESAAHDNINAILLSELCSQARCSCG